MIITITDVTRFKRQDFVCVAGINEFGECIRPIHYFSVADCKQYNIFPGSIIEGNFYPIPNIEKPHIEDCTREKIDFVRYSTIKEFYYLLHNICFSSVEDGFNVNLSYDTKCIPDQSKPQISLITVCVDPKCIQITRSDYRDKPLKVNFTDNSLKSFRYMPFTDKYLYNKIFNGNIDTNIYNINNFIQNQKIIMLRLGLSRMHNVKDRYGYWIQVNGIHTFPEWISGTRGLT